MKTKDDVLAVAKAVLNQKLHGVNFGSGSSLLVSGSEALESRYSHLQT
jgi:hypothetical protein